MTNDPGGGAPESLDFEDVFGEERESEKSLESAEVSWEEARSTEAQRKGVDADKLVRFVHNGKVHWITHEEATTFLQIADDQDKRQNAIKREIKRALRGEGQALADDLSVMLDVSASTVSRYNQDSLLSSADIRDAKLNLQRRAQEAETLLDCLDEVEETIRQKRKQAPILDEYEGMLGHMMNLSRQGRQAEAAKLAEQLENKKRQYVMMSRAIEPDVSTNYFYRMELHKTKRRVLTLQNQLSEKRAKRLDREIDETNKDLTQRHAEMEAQDKLIAQGVPLSEEEKEKYKTNAEEIAKAREEIVKKENERDNLNKESEILRTNISHADDVITYISDQVLKESGQEDAVRERARMLHAKRSTRKPGLHSLQMGKSSSRMATVDRRQRQ